MVEYSQEKIVTRNLKIPKKLLDSFKLAVRSEGYSVQDALILLIEQYLDTTNGK